jgi:hypothetical protein
LPIDDAIKTKLEAAMPELLSEMREDLSKNPLTRVFSLRKRKLSYTETTDPEFIYYYEDHDQLRSSKVRILENVGLIHEITSGNVERFVMTEKLVDYLSK